MPVVKCEADCGQLLWIDAACEIRYYMMPTILTVVPLPPLCLELVRTAVVLCDCSILHQSWTITAFILPRYDAAALYIGIGRTVKRISQYADRIKRYPFYRWPITVNVISRLLQLIENTACFTQTRHLPEKHVVMHCFSTSGSDCRSPW